MAEKFNERKQNPTFFKQDEKFLLVPRNVTQVLFRRGEQRVNANEV